MTTTRRQLPNVVALASLPTLRWHCHPCHAGIFGVSSSLLQWCPLCPRCAGIVVVVALALSPSLHWCHCPCCADLVAVVALVLMTSLRWYHHCWHLCHCCAGIFAIVALASVMLLHWHLCCWSTDTLADARCSVRGTILSC
jgi:hypothetical protein